MSNERLNEIRDLLQRTDMFEKGGRVLLIELVERIFYEYLAQGTVPEEIASFDNFKDRFLGGRANYQVQSFKEEIGSRALNKVLTPEQVDIAYISKERGLVTFDSSFLSRTAALKGGACS